MTTTFRSILLVAAIAMFAQVTVGAMDFVLDNATRDQLNKGAREAYDQSQVYLDKVNYQPALDSLIAASEKQPDMPELCFLVGSFASYEARKHVGEEAIGLLRKAESAYEKVLDTQCFGSLRHADRLTAESSLAKVKAAIAGEADRDARIEKVAQAVIKSDADLIEKMRAARAAEIVAQNGLSGTPGQGGAVGGQNMGMGGGQNRGGNQGLAATLNNASRGSGASVTGGNLRGGAVVGGRSSGGNNGGRRGG